MNQGNSENIWLLNHENRKIRNKYNVEQDVDSGGTENVERN